MADYRLSMPLYFRQSLEVQAVMMGLWHGMMARGHGHLAHLVIDGGTQAVMAYQMLRSPLMGSPETDVTWFTDNVTPWLKALAECLVFMRAAGWSQTAQDKVNAHRLAVIKFYEEAVNFNHVKAGRMNPKARQDHEEHTSCEPAHSSTAKSPSSQGCSAAADTGSASAPASSEESGTPTAPGKPAESAAPPSETSKEPSSPKRVRQGKGHPKRGNPYTKGSGKHLP